MAYQKLAVLAHRLHQRTIEGRLEWEVTATSEVYQTSFANYSINISKLESRSEIKPDIEISVFDDEGVELESFLDEDLSDSMFEEFAEPDTNAYQIMSETYDVARRTALGSEKAINEILSNLDDSGHDSY